MHVLFSDKEIAFQKKYIAQETSVSDTTTSRMRIEKALAKLNNDGYFNASVIAKSIDKNEIKYEIYVGEKFHLSRLLVYEADSNKLVKTERISNGEDILFFKKKWMSIYENNGFPFVQLNSTLAKTNLNKYDVIFEIKKGNKIVFDSMVYDKNVKIKKRFLHNYLNIPFGKPYNERAIQQINNRLQQLSYVELKKSTEVRFTEKYAQPILHIGNRRNSQIDFMIGLLPDNQGKLLVTGDAKLNLTNPFGNGIAIMMNWQRVQVASQQLKINIRYPYIFQKPFAARLGFNLDKVDSSYLEIDQNVGLQTLLGGENYIEVGFRQFISNLIRVDTTIIKAQKKLPQNLDIQSQQFILATYWDKTNSKIAPTKGFALSVKGAVINRKVKRNNAIISLKSADSFSFESMYDTLKQSKTQYTVELNFSNYYSIIPRLVLANSLKSNAIIADNLMRNELVRIGGIQNLRGFDDRSVFVSKYALLNTEIRYLITRNSYFAVLYDIAFVEQKWQFQQRNDWLMAVGAGISFDTKIGVFNLSYALGKSSGNNFEYKRAKIHFGYVTLF